MNIDKEIKESMLAKDSIRLTTVKAIKAAFTVAKTEKGASGELTEEQELKIIQKLFNQRKESFDIFTKQNRPELAEIEKGEMDVLSSFLPAQLSDEDLKVEVENAITETSASTIKDMGKVIALVSKNTAGKVDGGRISKMVKNYLNK